MRRRRTFHVSDTFLVLIFRHFRPLPIAVSSCPALPSSSCVLPFSPAYSPHLMGVNLVRMSRTAKVMRADAANWERPVEQG